MRALQAADEPADFVRAVSDTGTDLLPDVSSAIAMTA
jgi:hypothetical protein